MQGEDVGAKPPTDIDFNEEESIVTDSKNTDLKIDDTILIEEADQETNEKIPENLEPSKQEADQPNKVDQQYPDKLKNIEIEQEVVVKQVAKISIKDMEVEVEDIIDNSKTTTPLVTESQTLPKRSQSESVSDHGFDKGFNEKTTEQTEHSGSASDDLVKNQDQPLHRPRIASHARAASLNTKPVIPRKRFISTESSLQKNRNVSQHHSFSEPFESELLSPSYMKPTFASLSKRQDRHLV